MVHLSSQVYQNILLQEPQHDISHGLKQRFLMFLKLAFSSCIDTLGNSVCINSKDRAARIALTHNSIECLNKSACKSTTGTRVQALHKLFLFHGYTDVQ